MRRKRNRHGSRWAVFGLGLLLGLYPVPTLAGSVSLVWDANTETDLAGYRVHVGIASRAYSQTLDVGHVTTATIPNLSDGETYFFAVTAYDVFANESALSNETSTTLASSNSPPSASFTTSCSDFACIFTNTSIDSDGSLVAFRWDFGDGNSSTAQNPSHTYPSSGTYAVTLTVTDDGAASNSISQNVAVTGSADGRMTLSAIGYKVKGLQKVDLRWDGSTATAIDIYRDGAKITTTANGGFYTDHIDARGRGAHSYQVCGQGSSTCSNVAAVATFK